MNPENQSTFTQVQKVGSLALTVDANQIKESKVCLGTFLGRLIISEAFFVLYSITHCIINPVKYPQ